VTFIAKIRNQRTPCAGRPSLFDIGYLFEQRTVRRVETGDFSCISVRDRTDNYELAGVNTGMGQAERPTCPGCGAFLMLALPPGGKGQRTFQCLRCDGPDPLKTDQATGWLNGELQPPK
jgi:hypothetical protein